MDNKFTLPQLKLIIENPINNTERIAVRTSRDASEIFREIWEPSTMDLYESVYVLFLNKALRVLGFKQHSFGGISSSLFDHRLILSTALLSASTTIIVAHNHPTGNKQPSLSDETVTKQLKLSCELLNINLSDHLIITSDSYFSFADEGIL